MWAVTFCDKVGGVIKLNNRMSYKSRGNFVVQSLSHVLLFATPWTVAHQAPLSFTASQSLLKFMSIESLILSNYLSLCHPLLLLPSIFPSIRIFSNESALHIRWPKYWSFSFSITPSNEYSGLISFRTDWFGGFPKEIIPPSLPTLKSTVTNFTYGESF